MTKKISIKDIAELINAQIVGNPDLVIENVAKIDEAKEGDLSFIYQAKYEKFITDTKATAVIVSNKFNKACSVTLLKTEDPYWGFIKVIENYFIPYVELPDEYIPTGNENFSFGRNFRLGKNVHIGKDVTIGDSVTIFSNAVIMNNVTIGDNTIIYPNVTIREYCRIGKNNIIHSGAVIGSDGFGYYKNPDKSYHKIPQIGIVVLEDDVEIGSNTSIDRATVGETRIKRGTKIDNLVQIAHNCEIGEDCAISGQVGLSGTTKLGNRVVVAGQAGFAGHLTVGDDAIIMAQAGVDKDLKGGKLYVGAPAKERMEAFRNWAMINNLGTLFDEVKELKAKINLLERELNNNLKG